MTTTKATYSEPIDVLGCFDCFVGSLETAASAVLDLVAENVGGYVCLCNAHVAVSALHSQVHSDAVSGATLALPDGVAVAAYQRLSGHRTARRIAGPDLMARLLFDGRSRGIRHFLLGTTDDTLDRLVRRISGSAPGVQFVGTFAPPFYAALPEGVDAELVEHVRSVEPDIVWVGLGAPKQDIWMARYTEALAPAVLVGVGAAFDFLSGAKARAPLYMQRAGLEWLYRLGSEPRRLAGRYGRTNVEFIVRAVPPCFGADSEARNHTAV